jgi:hypothetical protein
VREIMTKHGLVVVLALVTLVGCSDWDSASTKIARQMQRIGYGCSTFQRAETKRLADRGISSAGTCDVRGQLVTIEVYKNDVARQTDRIAHEDRCRQAPQPDRAFQALPYAEKNNAVVQGVFLDAYRTPPSAVAALWTPVVNGIASAIKGQVHRPSC